MALTYTSDMPYPQNESEMLNYYQNVQDGKAMVANAITEKGVKTNKYDTFGTMAANIYKLDKGGSGAFADSYIDLMFIYMQPVSDEEVTS